MCMVHYTIKPAQRSLTYLNEAASLSCISCYSMLEQLLSEAANARQKSSFIHLGPTMLSQFDRVVDVAYDMCNAAVLWLHQKPFFPSIKTKPKL